MTPTHARIAALVALLVALVALGVNIVRQRASATDSAAAVAVINRLTMRLDTARAVAGAAQAEALVFKQQRDSLMRDARTARRYAVRQRTTVVIDTGDTSSVVAGVAALVAERDTAIRDRDAARADAEGYRLKLVTMDSLATVHATTDSVRLVQIVAVIDTSHIDLHTARALVRPRWFVRWGRGLGRASKVAGVAVIAFTLGRSL